MTDDDLLLWPDHPWQGVIPEAIDVWKSPDGSVGSMGLRDEKGAERKRIDFRLSPLPTAVDVMTMVAILQPMPRLSPAKKAGAIAAFVTKAGYKSPWPEFKNA